jgi:uncharacterized protein (TIGR02145 family)
MKRISFIFTAAIAFIIAITITLFFASCGAQRETASAPPPCPVSLHDDGVVINGVRWATRNVDIPGTFAELPTSEGKFYRPVRSRFSGPRWQAWAASGFSINPRSRLHVDSPVGPCPEGWRLPTDSEFRSLIDAGSRAVSMNGVKGRLFGTEPNQIFLPAAGVLHIYSAHSIENFNGISTSIEDFNNDISTGTANVEFVGRYGQYWSWHGYGLQGLGRGLYFSTITNVVRSGGGSNIRCVAM